MGTSYRSVKNGRIKYYGPKALRPWGWTRSQRVWKAAWMHRRGYLNGLMIELARAMDSDDTEVHRAHGFTVIARAP